jgi:hypothetical protein
MIDTMNTASTDATPAVEASVDRFGRIDTMPSENLPDTTDRRIERQ